MEKTEILALFDHEQRIALEPPDVTKTVFTDLIRYVYPAPRMNYILYSKIAQDQLDARIQAEIAYFAALNQPFSWYHYEHDQNPQLAEKLIAHGFAPDHDPDAIMLLDLQEDTATFHRNSHVEIQPIGIEQLDIVAQIEAQVWGGNFAWLSKRLGDHLRIKDYLEIFVASVEHTAASSGWIYLYPNSQFAGLFGGATLPQHRGQGLYNALLAARIEVARQRGYRFVFTGASSMSQPILANHGFRLLTRAYAYEWAGHTLV